jgi:hypothetical protein
MSHSNPGEQDIEQRGVLQIPGSELADRVEFTRPSNMMVQSASRTKERLKGGKP